VTDFDRVIDQPADLKSNTDMAVIVSSQRTTAAAMNSIHSLLSENHPCTLFMASLLPATMPHPTEHIIMKHRYFATEYIAEYKDWLALKALDPEWPIREADIVQVIHAVSSLRMLPLRPRASPHSHESAQLPAHHDPNNMTRCIEIV
jgi:hypothetical protein